MVLAARLPPVDRRRAGRGSPFFAQTREPSTHARVQSSSPTAFSSASRMRCSCSKTPAAASGPGTANTSVRSRTPAPAAEVARRCRGAERTRCPVGTVGPALVSAQANARARAAAAVRFAPTSRHPRSTAESSHHDHGQRQRHHADPAPGRRHPVGSRTSGPSATATRIRPLLSRKGSPNIKSLGKLRYVVEQTFASNSTTPSPHWPAASSAGDASRRPGHDRVTSPKELSSILHHHPKGYIILHPPRQVAVAAPAPSLPSPCRFYPCHF